MQGAGGTGLDRRRWARRTLPKLWSKNGQKMVKEWPNDDQRMVSGWLKDGWGVVPMTVAERRSCGRGFDRAIDRSNNRKVEAIERSNKGLATVKKWPIMAKKVK